MSDKPHYHGHRQRLRQRLLDNPASLADYEVLELALAYTIPRRDTKPLAKELMSRFSTLRGVFNAPPEDLRPVKGFGPAQEAHFALWRELRARIEESGVRERAVLDSPEEVARIARARLGGKRDEEFWISLVDTRLRLIGWERISEGTVNRTAVYPREIIRMALSRKATGVFLVHNHPGGSLAPSSGDMDLTRKVIMAAQGVDLLVHDHIIVTDDASFSFHDQGLVFPEFIQG